MNIDFHAHILPGADHGSKDLSVSLQQLKLAQQAGIDLLVATPHFYPKVESCAEFLSRRKQCAQQLLQAKRHSPEILIGAEVQLCTGLEQMSELEELCIEGTNILLLELPPNYSIRRYDQTLDALLYGRKLTVVLAHIDRYDPIHVDFLLEMGCLAQINAAAFHRFGVTKRAMHRVQSESVVALGSDIHGTDVGYHDFLKAKKRLGQEYDRLMARTAALLQIKTASPL